MPFTPPDEFYNPPGTAGGPPIDYTNSYPGDPDRILRQSLGVDDTGAANQPPQPGNPYDVQAKALGNPSGQVGPGWTAPLPDDTPTPKAAPQPGSAAVPSGPQAMAVGEGWYIDSHGRFVSDNMGANARANTPYDKNPSVGAGTIVDNGKPGNTGNPLSTYGELSASGRTPNLAGYGTGGGDFGGQPGSAALGSLGGGQQAAAGNGLAMNPKLGDTVAQTYGGYQPLGSGPRPGTGGHEQQLAGGNGDLDPAHRIVRDQNGHVVAVTDRDGYIPMDLKFHTIDEILLNAQELHPEAVELAKTLAAANAGQPSLEAQSIIRNLPADWQSSQMYADAATAHNKTLGANAPLDNVWAVPNNPQANSSVFGGQNELVQLLELSGRKVLNPLDVAGNVIFTGTDGVTRQTPVAGPMVANEIAKLRAEIAANRVAPSTDTTYGGGYGRTPRGGNGGSTPPGNGGGTGPGAQGVLNPATEHIYAGNPSLLNDYQQSPSYDNNNLQQVGRNVPAYNYGYSPY